MFLSSYCHAFWIPNWIPNQPVIIPAPQTYPELEERQKYIEENNNGMSWYLSFKEPPENCIEQKEDCNRIEEK